MYNPLPFSHKKIRNIPLYKKGYKFFIETYSIFCVEIDIFMLQKTKTSCRLFEEQEGFILVIPI